MRAREDDGGSDANHRKQPPLMGGDGARGPGVIVDTMKDLPEPPTTVTLELMRSLDETDSTPPLCRVVGDRKALCDASELIRNMVDDFGHTDSLTIPVPVEYIPSELVLRRLIEFAELQPTIPARFFTERGWCRTYDPPRGDVIKVCPRSEDIWIGVRELFRKYVDEDAHRGGILDLFLASRYLMASKLRIATLQYIAMMITSWCAPGADTTKPLFGSVRGVDRFGTDDDPLAKIPLPILSEISDVLLNDPVREGKAIHAFSPTLFKSLAVNSRFWEPWLDEEDDTVVKTMQELYSEKAKPEDPSCHLSSLLETRLEAYPTEPSGLVPAILAPTVHEHWFPLRRRVMEQCINDEAGHWRCGPPQWLVSNMDLANPDCAFMALTVERMKLRPGKTVAVPRLPAGGKETIAECWRGFYEHVSTEAESIAYEFVASSADAKVYCVKEVASILQHTTSLRGLHIYQKPTATGAFPEFPPSFSAQLDAAMISALTIDRLSIDFATMLPSSVSRVWIRKLADNVHCLDGLFGNEFSYHDLVVDVDDYITLKAIIAGLRVKNVKDHLEFDSRSLRVWFVDCSVGGHPAMSLPADMTQYRLGNFLPTIECFKVNEDDRTKGRLIAAAKGEPRQSEGDDEGTAADAAEQEREQQPAPVEAPNFYC